MSAVVVNRLHLTVPVDEIAPVIARELVPALDSIAGFERFYFVKTAEDRADIVIVWSDVEAAAAGAAVLGPTLFAKHLAPILASPQERAFGPALVAHAAT